MAAILLVHGAWHGGWCWEKVAPGLEALGHEVAVPTLPGHDLAEGVPATTTLKDYGQAVADAARAMSSPPILVGHSMGGGVIAQAAPLMAAPPAAMVYLAAFALRDGEAIALKAADDPEQILGEHMVFIDEGARAIVDAAHLAEVFYGDCSPEDQKAAAARLVPQTAQPLLDPLEDGEAVGLSVPRFAIVCTQDRAIGPTRQREMAESVGAEIFELPASHSPFYSMPERVVDLIDRIAHADAKKA